MSYVEDFLDINSTLPRDFIRLSKLMREIDEKSFSKINYKITNPFRFLDVNKILLEFRKKYLNLCKSKNRNEKTEQEILKSIDKEYNSLLILSDHKVEIENEITYLSEFHLKKSNEIIDSYEKNLAALNQQQGSIFLAYGDYKGEKALSMMADDMSISGSSI